jgi:hypothetical protein
MFSKIGQTIAGECLSVEREEPVIIVDFSKVAVIASLSSKAESPMASNPA